jgi:hypothetical protein
MHYSAVRAVNSIAFEIKGDEIATPSTSTQKTSQSVAIPDSRLKPSVPRRCEDFRPVLMRVGMISLRFQNW